MVANNFNFLSFEEGIERIKKALQRADLRLGGDKIVTSRDKGIREVMDDLEIANMGDGFKKWQLPVFFDPASKQGAQFFITSAESGQKVNRHSHDEGDGIRFIAGGSVIYNGVELSQGDWMYIPEGAEYELDIGRHGALMCYCYQCCCVPK